MSSQYARVRGFTLIEAMIAILIMSILLVVAVPSFQDASLNSQLRATANNVVSSAMFARSEALKRNAVVTVCVSVDGANCTTGGWEKGWIVKAGTQVLERQMSAPPGYKISAAGGNAQFQFQPTGAGTTTDTLIVCRATPRVANTRRTVSIDAAGRAMVAQSATTTCT